MTHRIARTHRVWTATIVGLALSALSLGPAFAQVAQSKTCLHEGKVYKPGDKLTIGGKEMVCDGATGTWVASKG